MHRRILNLLIVGLVSIFLVLFITRKSHAVGFPFNLVDQIVSLSTPKPLIKEEPKPTIKPSTPKPIKMVKYESPIIKGPFKVGSSLVDEKGHFNRNFPKFVEVMNNEFAKWKDKAHWFAGQIEHESCATKNKCWNERSQLFTYEDLMSGKRREYGFGLGQITITKKFNNFEVLKEKHISLRNWRFDQRFDARRQIIALFVLDNICYNQVKFASKVEDRYAMMFACYNGGYGHIVKDRQLCIQKGPSKCDPTLWFNNIEKDSVKSKVAKKGYGKSFFEINRHYPKDIMYNRSKKYVPLVDKYL